MKKDKQRSEFNLAELFRFHRDQYEGEIQIYSRENVVRCLRALSQKRSDIEAIPQYNYFPFRKWQSEFTVSVIALLPEEYSKEWVTAFEFRVKDTLKKEILNTLNKKDRLEFESRYEIEIKFVQNCEEWVFVVNPFKPRNQG